MMKPIFLALTVLFFGCENLQDKKPSKIVGVTIPLYEISYLNSNLQKHRGEKIRIQGYVLLGKKGGHLQCRISSEKKRNTVSDGIWLAYDKCYEKNAEYREGKATVIGILHDNGGESYIGGSLYRSQLKNVYIYWN